MIKFNSVTKKYEDFIAVDNLNLEIKSGELCVFLGPSGCGKSTTLRLLNRLLDLDSGNITIDDVNIGDIDPVTLRRGIGYVIQSVGLLPHYTVKENISIVPKLLKWDAIKIAERVDTLLDLVGLSPEIYKNKYPRELSGGEAQRVGVARALAADPPILLMDEPFGAVDPLTRDVLQREFLRIQKKLKKTVIFVTHDIEEAVKLGNKIAVLKDGKLIQYDTPDRIITKPGNSFIEEFIGKDGSLKLLLYYYVEKIMKNRIPQEDWVYNSESQTLLYNGFNFCLNNHCVYKDSSLKDTLAVMLKIEQRVLPVIDSDKKVIGEVYLEDIERVFGNANE